MRHRPRTATRPPPASRNGHHDHLTATAQLPLPGAARVPASAVNAGCDGQRPGRTAKGTFAVGNRCSAGNAFQRQLSQHRQAVFATFTADDTVRVMRRLHDAAINGDVPAAKVFLSYTLGKPAEQADPDRLNLDELALLMAAPTDTETLLHALNVVPTAEALEALKGIQAAKTPGKWMGTDDDDLDDDDRNARLGAVLKLKQALLQARAKKG
jgi:hypothetical protein